MADWPRLRKLQIGTRRFPEPIGEGDNWKSNPPKPC
jgi:hypothetical protein